MIAFLWRIIVGNWCKHDWEIISQGRLIDEGAEVGNFYDLKCKKCGEIKYVRCLED